MDPTRLAKIGLRARKSVPLGLTEFVERSKAVNLTECTAA